MCTTDATHSGLKQLPSDPRRVCPLPCAGSRLNDVRSDITGDRCAGPVEKCDLGNISNMNIAQVLHMTPPGNPAPDSIMTLSVHTSCPEVTVLKSCVSTQQCRDLPQ